MTNIVTRVKHFLNPDGMNRQAVADYQKGVFGNSWNLPFGYGAGLDGRNRDFTHSEYGAAQASQLLVDIAASINVWELYLSGIVWHIKEASSGTILFSTSDRDIPQGTKGARFLHALHKFRERYKHDYWKSIALSDWITGETYIRRIRNRGKIVSELQWLNPLATEPYRPSGEILYYTYTNDDAQEVGYTIPIQDMAYRMLRRNIFDDLRGYSPVMSVIDESNLSRNVKRAFKQYFRNGMILGGIVSPAGEEIWTDRERNTIQEQLFRNNRGVDNAHTWVISPRKMLTEAFTGKDTGKDIEVLQDLASNIHKALGVPKELAGMPTEATYENLEATQYGWYRLAANPYARDVAEYHNTQILPFIEPDTKVYLEPELSKYEIERPEVVSQDVNAGIISLYDAQVKRGLEPDERLKDIYMTPNGRHVSIDIIAELAQTMPSEEIKDRADAQAALTNANTSGDVDESTPQTLQVQYDENGTAIPQSEVFGYHIESGIVDINEARAQIGLPPIEKETASDTDLVQLNSQLQTIITAINAGMSIEEAYETVGLEPPKKDDIATPPPQAIEGDSEKSAKVSASEKSLGDGTPISVAPIDGATYGSIHDGIDDGVEVVHYSHGKHTHTLPIDTIDYSHENALSELKAWKKYLKNDNKRHFEAKYLRGDIADAIQVALEAQADIETVFDSAFETVKAWQKAIQSIRIDYTDDFNELLDRARDDSNNFGRRQWATALRSINRRYGRRGFSDGLINGGVLDGALSEEDENRVAELVAEASTHVTNLGKEIFRTENGVSDALANLKAEQWFRKTIMPFFDAGQLSASGNRMMEFGGDDGEESCSTCIRLKGQRHRHKSWARKALRPQIDTDNFDCGGFQCEHKLIPVRAKARGRF